MNSEFSEKTKREALARDGFCIICREFPRTREDDIPMPTWGTRRGNVPHHVFYRSSKAYPDLDGVWNCAILCGYHHDRLHFTKWTQKLSGWLEKRALNFRKNV